jgi:HKD family nuclease
MRQVAFNNQKVAFNNQKVAFNTLKPNKYSALTHPKIHKLIYKFKKQVKRKNRK